MVDLSLSGCTPEPLMNYLKALGVFRLVAEQADSNARLSWRGGVAHLHSTLGRHALIEYFTNEYEPTPIVGPWGGRSGFYPGSSESAAREAPDSIVSAADTNPRLEPFSAAILAIRNILARHGFKEKVRDEDKQRLMEICRNELDDSMLSWLDCVYVLTEDSRKFPPLLGTGGNEGSGSYVSTFAQIVSAMLTRQPQPGDIENAIFGGFNTQLGGVAVGHFNPGAIGGPNSSQGFSGGGGVNSWDYVFAIEGCLLFAGAASRHYGTDTAGRAAFPFCVEAVAVGYPSGSDKEAGKSTRLSCGCRFCEPVQFSELSRLFSEGRAQLGRQQAKNAVEFILALATLGVSRGIDSFVRYAFVMRNGLNYFAAPLGRVEVRARPQARLLEDRPLVEWLDRLRRACSDKEKTPARYQSALRQIDCSVFEFANRSESGNDATHLTNILTVLGQAEHALARGLRFAQEKYIRPLQGLNPQWLRQADDGQGRSASRPPWAGIRGEPDVVGPFALLEPVEFSGNYAKWSPGSTSAVWSNQSLASNLAQVFRRRQMEAFRRGSSRGQQHVGVPLRSPYFATLPDVVAFLRAELDEDKLTDLLCGVAGRRLVES